MTLKAASAYRGIGGTATCERGWKIEGDQMRGSPVYVLDVGNCDHDHAMIREMLTDHFKVSVDRAATVKDAIDRMRGRRYDLVLFNRIIDCNGREGIDIIRLAKADGAVPPVPIMMVSNLSEAQDACVAAGGVRGFGKAALDRSSTIELLAQYLPRQ
jgi:CheY-like chemotaxis protein